MSDSSVVPIKINISTTDPSAELGIRVLLDNVTVHENSHVDGPYSFLHKINDDAKEHELVIELFGKQPTHTKINEAGEIINDCMLVIEGIEIEDIDVLHLLALYGEYHHDFNGTQPPTVAKFYNNLGCNGSVKFKFSTPFYLWLLETM